MIIPNICIIQKWIGQENNILAGGNWNNSVNTGLGYLNSSNVASNNDRNIDTHTELRYFKYLNSFLVPHRKEKQITEGKTMLVPSRNASLSTTGGLIA